MTDIYFPQKSHQQTARRKESGIRDFVWRIHSPKHYNRSLLIKQKELSLTNMVKYLKIANFKDLFPRIFLSIIDFEGHLYKL